MSDISKSARDYLQSGANKSLSEKMGKLKAKIRKYRVPGESLKVLLCDVSGSMDTLVKDDAGSDPLGNSHHVRAIDVVQSVVDELEDQIVFAFHSEVEECEDGNLGEPRGGTEMHLAFDLMKIKNHSEIILLTDGQPNDQGAALRSAQGLKIQIIYIGPPPIPYFLTQLGGKSGNSFDSVELIAEGAVAGKKKLTSKIKGLLGA